MLSDAELKRIAHQTEIQTLSIESLHKFANAIRADEREACARVCDELAKRNFPWASENSDRYHAQADWAEKCAAAIRARKEKE